MLGNVNLGASYVQTYLVSWVGERVILDLRRRPLRATSRSSHSTSSAASDRLDRGRLTNDIDALDELVTDGVTSLVTNGLTIVGAVVLLFVLDVRLALATLADHAALLVAARSSSARARRAPMPWCATRSAT